MKKTIFSQIIIIYVILSLFIMGTFVIYTLQYLHKEQFQTMISKTDVLWQTLALNIENIYTLNSVILNQQVSIMSRYLHAQIFIYDTQDRVIMRYINGYLDDTEYEESELEKLARSEIKATMLFESGKHFYIKNYFISSYPIYYDTTLAGYFVVFQDREDVLASWNAFYTDLLSIVAIVIILSMIVFITFAHRLVAPIKHLTKIMSQVNIKNLDIPIIETMNNEISDLTYQFRQISSNLKTSIDEINTQKDLLLSIINTINQAIWIVDEKAIVQTANKHFEKLVGTDDYDHKYLMTLIRNHDLIKIYQDVVNQKESITREIEYKDITYLCTASYLTSNKNIIFTLLNISDIKSLEIMKKDLITNVSHELKTPLTAIKGFVETMLEDYATPLGKDDTTPNSKSFLEIISRNTDRLIFIVNDLLTLSKLERAPEIIKQEINIPLFFDKIKIVFSETLKKNNILLNIEIDENTQSLYADEYMLEQVFINLIDNSIKYAGKGEINIKAFSDNNKTIFTITDDGIGIPPKDQKRIFERFYVVDKSRSKKLGGTGLGLSIVKHIVNLHNGDITVESEENKGTIFRIEI